MKVRAEPERFVMLYQDELSVYRQPTQAWLWSHMGRCQPRLKYTSKFNTCMRLVGYLNAVTGATHCHDMKSVTGKNLINSLRNIPKWYPDAERIFLVWDNWQNHRLPDVLKALERMPQIEVLCLPTYSPWLNPIEKLWRWLKQTVIHAHQWSHDFTQFREKIMSALGGLTGGSEDLLRYVGLSI